MSTTNRTVNPTIREVWRDIKDYEGLYQVSNTGRVRSVNRTVETQAGARTYKSRILKKFIGTDGYYHVTLSRVGTLQTIKISVLMARAFIPNPENKLIVSHINDVKLDDRLDNLEWATRLENGKRAVENERSCKGNKNAMSVLTESDIPVIRRRIKNKEKIQKIAKDYDVAINTIYNIKYNMRWAWVK